MTIKDFFTPITISSTPRSVTKQSARETTTENSSVSAFTQNLQDAIGSVQSCDAGSTASGSDSSLSVSGLAGGVVDIGLGLATGNVLSSGIGSAAILQKLMKQDISTQFTQLGVAVAGNFLAGLAGEDSATEVASTAVSSAAELLGSATKVGGNLTKLSEESAAKTAESVVKAKKASLIDRTVHWPVQNLEPQTLLKADKQKANS